MLFFFIWPVLEARAEICQKFRLLLRNGVSRKIVFEIYWPLPKKNQVQATAAKVVTIQKRVNHPQKKDQILIVPQAKNHLLKIDQKNQRNQKKAVDGNQVVALQMIKDPNLVTKVVIMVTKVPNPTRIVIWKDQVLGKEFCTTFWFAFTFNLVSVTVRSAGIHLQSYLCNLIFTQD